MGTFKVNGLISATGTISATNGFIGDLTGNAATASKLATARTISLTGSVTGSGSFDGSGNLSIATAVNHTHDSSYVNVTGDTMTGALTVPSITISSTSPVKHINFNRTNANYISTAASGYFAFLPDGKDVGIANADLIINNGTLYSGTNNTTSLGQSSYRWKNIYSNALNLAGDITYANDSYTDYAMIKFITGDANGAGIIIGGGGLTVIGSGESASNLVSAIGLAGSSELTCITSDTDINFYTNCQTIANRKTATLDTSGNLNLVGSITISHATSATMDYTSTNPRVVFSENGSQPVGLVYTDYDSYRSPAGLKVLDMSGSNSKAWFEVEGNIYGAKVYGAVWNDYAEFRNQDEEIEPGYCVTSSKSGKVYKTTKRLQYCEGIVSDTFGFSIGETDKCKTPLAVSGRVLAYYDGNINDYEIGDAVCASINGLITKMTREEIKEYPDRIIGTVSEIPSYKTWGNGNVPTVGRIWIKVK